MKTEVLHCKITQWRSEQRPDVVTDNPDLAEVIAWADSIPHVWHIVSHQKSKAFGVGSCTYIGWAQRGLAPDILLERVRHLHEHATGRAPHLSPSHIVCISAKFTVEHYKDRGFTGGFFRQHDEKHERLCMTLEYTPETLDEVTGRFLLWCGRDHETTHVTVDGNIVRSVED